MKRLLCSSIRLKLMGMIMGIASLALIAAFAIFGVFDVLTERRDMVRDLTSVAEIVGINSTAALSFGDREAGAETLDSLRDQDHVVSACLYSEQGEVFSEYQNVALDDTSAWPEARPSSHRFGHGRLVVFHLIELDGEGVGTVYIEASLAPLYARIRGMAGIAGMALLASLVIAFGLTSLLEGSLSRPIINLAATARVVSESKNYEVRAVGGPLDEVGQLIHSFNQMLAEIQSRDEALSHSERHFRSLIENASDIIMVLDAEGNIQYASPSAVRLTGSVADEVTGRPLFSFVHPQDELNARTWHSEVNASPATVCSVEFRFGSEQSHWELLESVASNLLNDPAVGGIVVNARDITERARAEAKLEAFAQSLESSNRELQDFAYVASHDLQEPLRKIQAFGERLKVKCGEALGEQGEDYLARMTNAAQRMQALITSLLEFSRVTSKARPFVPVDLQQVAREVLNDLEIRVEQVGGTVEVGDLPEIEADPAQMRQLLQNLIGNALKFHRDDIPPLIRVSAVKAPREGARANSLNGTSYQIRVEDNGVGFDEKYGDRIFGIFQRLHGRNEFEGTGVGLSICRKIADRHGGDITASSAPGEGATFTVTLPKHQETAGVAA